MPRFVILEHDHPERHWDFMLETGSVLRTWRLSEPPRPGVTITAAASFDHRLVYLDYEGPVSGNRGTVTAWERGTYEEEPGSSAARVLVRLEGQRLRGSVVLERDSAGGWVCSLAESGERLK